MSEYLNRKTLIDKETGEIVKTSEWIGHDGFNSRGYRYRPYSNFIRYYWDSLPYNFSKDAWYLMFMIAELMNEENALVYRVKRKSKFSSIIYKPMDKDDIRERLRFKMGINRFDKAWKQLTKYILKQANYNGITAWIVNPAVISRCKEIPLWLYDEFKDEIDPHLSAITIKKFRQKLLDLNEEDQYV